MSLTKEVNKPDAMDLNLWIKLIFENSYRLLGANYIGNSFAVRKMKFDDSWTLLNIVRGMGVTDPRDMIYGLLGIHDIGVIPDYGKSCRDVYIDLAVAEMEESFDSVLLKSRYFFQAAYSESIRNPILGSQLNTARQWIGASKRPPCICCFQIYRIKPKTIIVSGAYL